jgi:hypothetical protein
MNAVIGRKKAQEAQKIPAMGSSVLLRTLRLFAAKIFLVPVFRVIACR